MCRYNRVKPLAYYDTMTNPLRYNRFEDLLYLGRGVEVVPWLHRRDARALCALVPLSLCAIGSVPLRAIEPLTLCVSGSEPQALRAIGNKPQARSAIGNKPQARSAIGNKPLHNSVYFLKKVPKNLKISSGTF